MNVFRETIKVIVKTSQEIDTIWKDKFNPELHEEITEGEIVKPVEAPVETVTETIAEVQEPVAQVEEVKEEIINPTEDEPKPKRTRKSTKEAGEHTVSEEGDAEVRETVGE